MLKKIDKVFDKLGNIIGNINAVVLVLLILNVFYDAIMRYFFQTGSIALQELEWHFFSVIILLGMAYAMQQDAHVRVDIIYDTLSRRKQVVINIVGVILLVLPVMAIIGYGAIDYVIEAYQSNEQSGDPGGLTHRWIVKSLIPLSFLLLIISAIGFIIKQLTLLSGDSEALSSIEGDKQ
ncbi:MAG: C4-dicarboxylate ABC transporter permease [Deltaproteobacteria bacterium]|nr:MAG: C4-dicarboxylate ABC transporter permease [Gammaproteobacteria bacterium]PIE74376.1 MAG: C4-dicarboxylate ABC transporter permease [Deltaproteobacteria bacterium]